MPAAPLSFGHAALAQRIVAELVASLQPGAGSSTEPALVVGVFGEWGAGKSRLLQTVADALQDRSKGEGEQALTVVVPFNAWRYEREEHLLVPLLRVAQQCLRKAIDDSLGTDIKRHEQLSDQLLLLGDLAQVVYQHGGRDLLQAALTAHGAAVKLPELKPADGKPNPGVWEVLASRRKLRANARRLDTPINQLQSLYYDFLENLKAVTGRNPSALSAHRQRLLRRGASGLTDFVYGLRAGWEWFLTGEVAAAPSVQVNLIFLVDDLDRCLPDKAVEVLEAIKLFLEVEGCAFVLALDEEVIERGIAHRYRDYSLQGKEGMTPITGAEYLEKLVHLPVRLPRPTGAAAREFMAGKWPAWFADPAGQPNDLAVLVAAITPGVPRKLYRMAALLALAESLGEGDARTPNRREWLAIVCALQLFAPALYRFLRLHGAQYLLTLATWRGDALFRDLAGLRQALQAQTRGVDSPVKLHHQLVLQRLPDLCEAVMHNRSGFDLLELLARVGGLHAKAELTVTALGALLVFTEIEVAPEPPATDVAPPSITPAAFEATLPEPKMDVPSAVVEPAPPTDAPQPARLENERALAEAVDSGELELVRVALSREGAALRNKVFPKTLWDLLRAGRLTAQLQDWIAREAPADATQFLLQELRPHLSQAAVYDLLMGFGRPVLQVLKRPPWAHDVRVGDGLTFLAPPLIGDDSLWLDSMQSHGAEQWHIPRGWACASRRLEDLTQGVGIAVGSDEQYGVYAKLQVGGFQQRLRWVPQGKLAMGSPNGHPEERQLRTVSLMRGFWIADTACTLDFWHQATGSASAGGDGRRPVTGVSAEMVEHWLAQLQQRLPGCEVRLPSEAEWEAACRAGTRTLYAFGDEANSLLVNAENDAVVPVASLPPNAWGLYEMHGNVAEICRDWLDANERTSEAWMNPEGLPGAATGLYAVRGGSFRSSFVQARSAAVARITRDERRDDVGFRFIVRAIQAPEAEPA
ncbi:P-loop NTPase fold protein [Roseateles sp. LYH14W]|uniref:P-loop NTPase fold protein n=1 Tax=Pelomonas parva TaxID=3299032 RepID=A0ABW7EZP6_9BURK